MTGGGREGEGGRGSSKKEWREERRKETWHGEKSETCRLNERRKWEGRKTVERKRVREEEREIMRKRGRGGKK